MAKQNVDWVGDITLKVRVRLADQDREEVDDTDLQRLAEARILSALASVDFGNDDVYSTRATGQDLILWDDVV